MKFPSAFLLISAATALIETRWPDRVLAPYLVMHPNSDFDSALCMYTTGLQYFTLSHVNADKNDNPAWLGKSDISIYTGFVEDIRNQGGDVIVSFGGSEGGIDLALVAETHNDLAAIYQSVIDLYNLTAIDVDIYGNETDADLIKKRSLALVSVKNSNPNLRISVTLSANSTGFDSDSLFIVQSFIENSFTPDVINLLTLDFENALNSSMSDNIISAATGAFETLQALNFSDSTLIGLSPMIGQNDISDEIFQLNDAVQLNEFAKENSWVGLIAFWNLNRDKEEYAHISKSSQIVQSDFEFTRIFVDWQTFEKQLVSIFSLDTKDLPTAPTIGPHVSHSAPAFVSGDPSLPEANSTGIARSTSCSPLVRINFNNYPTTGRRVGDWNQCTQYFDTCNRGMVCCVAPGQSNNVATCRMAGQAPGTVTGCAGQQPPIPNVAANALPPCAVNFRTTQLTNPLPLLPPSGTYYFGVWWNNDDGDSPQNVYSRLQISKRFPLWQMNIPMSSTELAVNYFDEVWGKAINLNTNAVFFISIFPSCILPYVSDFAIQTLAYRLKAIIDTGRNVWVRYAPEMNGNWAAYQQDPVNYVLGFQKFVTLTRAITGTARISMLWSPNVGRGYPWGGIGDPNNPYAPYYPGDSYVDMVGLSIYHFGVWQSNGIYANTDPLPGQLADWIDSFVKQYSHKPFVLSETAGTTNMAAQDAYGNWYTLAGSDATSRRRMKQIWWRQIAAVATTYPTFIGAMIFDFIKYEGATYRDFTVTGGTPGIYSPVGNDGSALDGPTLSAFRTDINNGVFGNVFWADSDVADWDRCHLSSSRCSTSSFICCFGSATDFTIGAKTCRPTNNCYGVSDQSVCNAQTDVCSNADSKCCSGSGADYLAGVTKCLTSCYSPIAQWNDCNVASDTCLTSGDQCCFGSANDTTAGKTTCRPSSNCLRATPVQPDANFQAGYNWASKIFAPFIDVSVAPAFDVIKFSNSVGSSRYIFGFITSAADGSPAWSGTSPIRKLDWLEPIQAMRLFGGDAIISFGGPTGTELALTAKSSLSLQVNYQNVVDGYNVRWLDFSISGSALTDQASINLRNRVLRAMQVSNPNLMISYTLPTTATGLTLSSLAVLTSALNYGVRVDVVNLLITSTSVAAAAAAQLQALGMTAQLGLTPTIGVDSVRGTTFQVNEATAMVAWAKSNSRVRLISLWNANRDTSARSGVTQKDRQFSQSFVQYEN